MNYFLNNAFEWLCTTRDGNEKISQKQLQYIMLQNYYSCGYCWGAFGIHKGYVTIEKHLDFSGFKSCVLKK